MGFCLNSKDSTLKKIFASSVMNKSDFLEGAEDKLIQENKNNNKAELLQKISQENEDNRFKESLREQCTVGNNHLKCSNNFKLLTFGEAPSHLQFNPFILTGYRGYLPTKICLESVFWWTNETINIWTHIFGWMLFLGLTLYDLLLLNIHASLTDKFIVGMLLVCFQICMILSSLYHTFSCRSEKDYWCFLTYDLLGISLSLLAIYLSGIYYAFWCHKEWQQFYLLTVLFIFLIAMVLQVPRFNVSSNLKLAVFVAWAAYGVVPTFHWVLIMGGTANPVVQLLLPRVLGMYAISGFAFFIYITKIPERFFVGAVDYIGSSHQWWHFFVVLALYYWHNTGIKYVEYRMNHGCLPEF